MHVFLFTINSYVFVHWCCKTIHFLFLDKISKINHSIILSNLWSINLFRIIDNNFNLSHAIQYLYFDAILILIFQKSGIKVSRNNCFIFCSKKRDESTIEEDRTIYIYRTVRPVKINWYVSRCSESFLENAPDARWGVALADRHCLESPSFIRPTCRMLDAYQFMPHLRIPRVGGEPLSLFLSLLPFRTPGAWLTSGEAFPFDITYVLTIPGVTSPRRK